MRSDVFPEELSICRKVLLEMLSCLSCLGWLIYSFSPDHLAEKLKAYMILIIKWVKSSVVAWL